MPPRNPEPSEAIDATILSTNNSATVRNDKSSIPATRKAPWPDDMICGDTIASNPTTRPPAMVRSAGRNRNRANIFSLIATPRMRSMPSAAERRPSVAATTRSWIAMVIFSGATMPSSAGANWRATR